MKTDYAQLAQNYPLSVIIPCYNAAVTLQATLTSLLENDLSNVEVIVVDDHSTDDTAEMIKRLDASFMGGIQYFRMSERGGPGAARNRGLGSAKYPFVFFLDADIVLPSQAICWIRETFDLYSHQPRVAGVLGTYNERVPIDNFPTAFKNLYTCYLYRMTSTLSPFIHTPMFSVRKEVLEQEGQFDSDMFRAEDFKLGVMLGSKGYRFVIDWRVTGTHLKAYTLVGILREDWRRIGELRRIELDTEQRRFSYRAHRWSRILSLVLPGTVILLIALGFIWKTSLWLAGLAFLAFFLVNLPLLFYFCRHRGILFATASLAFLFIEMLWAQCALTLSSLLPRHTSSLAR